MDRVFTFQLKAVLWVLVFLVVGLFSVNKFIALNYTDYLLPIFIFLIGTYLYADFIKNKRYYELTFAVVLFLLAISMAFP